MKGVSTAAMLTLGMLRNRKDWATAEEIGKALQGKVSVRTVRVHLLRFLDMKIVVRRWWFPEYHYRLADETPLEAEAYLAELNLGAPG